jgi:ArsR family transcriptional regulator
MLEIFGPRVDRGIGIDVSHEMLTYARTNLERAGLRNCQVRHGDMYRLPFADESMDAVVIHMVLHYAEEPSAVIAEAARVLRPGGRAVVVDFAPHEEEELRELHAHRRLGFSNGEVGDWYGTSGLAPEPPVPLPGRPLTVMLWAARRPWEAPQSSGLVKDTAET